MFEVLSVWGGGLLNKQHMAWMHAKLFSFGFCTAAVTVLELFRQYPK